MIVGIGIDSVDIQRFAHWHIYNPQILRRIFSDQEIDYCLQNNTKSAERFAVRFAAREALFKALTMHAPGHNIPFLTLCRAVSIQKHMNVPSLHINWPTIQRWYPYEPVTPLLSLTHTQHIATAWIVLQKHDNYQP
ncbi:MAG TPA: 4'-phosphopantetheinyl transferase superfamily protein [Candidatus Dependentiae bacterium]|nr:4'-phosphopantetheinyl transferase superfamily protein [Candidatus Dependentiae bacterium]HRQ63031.1 4'-phosphopantetheinyl transferase superfamily protein [Candidatus Dependentiae bacterium]